jgi:hypothetical protein
VEDQSAPIPEETTSELGRIIYIVRHAKSRIDQATLENEMGNWEDARSEEQSAYSLWRSSGIRRPSPGKRKVSGTITHQNSPPSIQTMVPGTFLFP